jgi:hypothetical protein
MKTIEMEVGDYISALRPALDGSIAMAIAVSVLRWRLESSHYQWLRLIVEISCGAAVYIATVALLHRERAAHFLNIAKRARWPRLQAQTGAALS